MGEKIHELTKRVYYGDIDTRRLQDKYEVWSVAKLRIDLYFKNIPREFINYKEGVDEYGGDYLEGTLKIVIPDTYKPKDFYIP